MNSIPVLFKLQFLLLLLFFVGGAQGQERKWPVRYTRWMDARAPVGEGYAVLTNGDTVKGFIKLLPITNSYPVLDTATNTIRDVYISDIVVMRIYAGSPDGPYMDYLNIDFKYSLWILKAKKNNVALYEKLGSTASPLILVTPNKTIKLVHPLATILHNDTGYDAALIRFIHKRYKMAVKEDDFATTKAIFTYIVDRENESTSR